MVHIKGIREDSMFTYIMMELCGGGGSWLFIGASIDLHGYKTGKTKSISESTSKVAADTSTQTDGKRK